MSIKLSGMAELEKNFNGLIDIVGSRKMKNALLGPAEELRAAIENAAPQGPTGNLKRSIVAKRFKRSQKGNPAVFVAIDRKIAPHAWLVEYGGRGGRMPANPFFRNTVDSKGGSIVNSLEKVAWDLIKTK